MRKSIITLIAIIMAAVLSPPVPARACMVTFGDIPVIEEYRNETTYKDGCKKISYRRVEQGKEIYSIEIYLLSKKHRGKHFKKFKGAKMTDVKRINHLFNILAKKHKENKGDVWADFIREYTPTKSEEKKLRALYDVYFVNEGVTNANTMGNTIRY